MDAMAEPKMEITVDAEGMNARIRLLRRGGPVTQEDIYAALERRGIVRGIKDAFVARLAEHTVYDRTFLIAQGQPPKFGQDGKIEIKVADEEALFPVKPDGSALEASVLDQIDMVQMGEEVCRRTPPTPGGDGYDLFGRVLPGANGREVELPPGRNTFASPEGDKLFAAITGHAVYHGGQLDVDTVTIVNTVESGLETLEVEGTLLVRGDIQAGSRVHASGDILVRGIVEGAQVNAGRNVVVAKGIKGRATLVKAGGHLRTGYAEHCALYVGENLYAEVLMSAQARCGGSAFFMGKKGMLLGGVLMAGADVYAVNIGNDAQTATSIQLGLGAQARARHLELEQAISKRKETLEKLKKVLPNVRTGTAEQKALATRARFTSLRIEQEIEQMQEELAAADQAEAVDTQSAVHVGGCLYPNVEINLDGLSYINQELSQECVVFKSGGRVRVRAKGTREK